MLRRFLLALLIPAALLTALPASALECGQFITPAACYCRFKADDPRAYCRGETTKLKEYCVNIFGEYADIGCAQDCIAAGYDPLNDSSGQPKGVRKLDDQYCDFDPSDCSKPPRNVNEVVACFRCFCTYKAGTQPVRCVGKTVFTKYTAYMDTCVPFCLANNYDTAGLASVDEGSQCDYRTADGCAKPLNPDAPGCKNVASINAAHDASIARALTGGSVLTLPLPLSNTSIPRVVGRIMNAVLGIVGGLALLLFVWGGLRWMLARGNPEEVGKAKQTITWAALGLLAIFSSYAILNFVITALRS